MAALLAHTSQGSNPPCSVTKHHNVESAKGLRHALPSRPALGNMFRSNISDGIALHARQGRPVAVTATDPRYCEGKIARVPPTHAVTFGSDVTTSIDVEVVMFSVVGPVVNKSLKLRVEVVAVEVVEVEVDVAVERVVVSATAAQTSQY